MRKLKIIELFGGIGACSKALERLGIDYEITDYVEIDKYAVKSFNAIHNTNFEPQDICEWDKDIEVDLIMHGSPCVDFSLAGKQAGGDKGSGTRSSLMYETIRIVEKLKPKYVIWENVKNLLSKKHRHNFDTYLETMESLGYTNYYQVLNAKDHSIPQNRERVFTISILGNDSFTFPPKQDLKLKLKDILEDNVDEKYYLSDEQVNKIKYSKFAQDLKDSKCVEVNRKYGIFDTEKSTHQAGSVYDENGLAPTLDTMQGGWRQPCIEEKGFVQNKYEKFIEEKGYIPEMFNPYNEKEIKDIAPTQSTYCGSMTSSATVLIKNNTKQGYLEASDVGCVVDKPRKDIKELDKYCKYCGNKLERKRFNGRLEDFKVFSNRQYCNRECMKKDYLKIGKHNQSYSNAHATARKINELILHKDVCEICGSKTNLDIHHIDGDWQNNNVDNLICLCRSCHMKEHSPKGICTICGKPQKGYGYCNKHYIRFKKYGDPLYTKYDMKKGGDAMNNGETNLRIRKLTPLER